MFSTYQLLLQREPSTLDQQQPPNHPLATMLPCGRAINYAGGLMIRVQVIATDDRNVLIDTALLEATVNLSNQLRAKMLRQPVS